MNKVHLFLITFLIIVAFNFAGHSNNHVFADDHGDKYEHEAEHEKGNDQLKEIGELVGWGAVIGMGFAGALFPIRRSSKIIITRIPNAKGLVISVSKWLGKYHVIIGILVMFLIILHGVSMYAAEGELETEGVIGLLSFLLLLLASLFGGFLIKNKKSKFFRKIHFILIILAGSIGILHILV